MSDMVGNPEDGFPRVTVHFIVFIYCVLSSKHSADPYIVQFLFLSKNLLLMNFCECLTKSVLIVVRNHGGKFSHNTSCMHLIYSFG